MDIVVGSWNKEKSKGVYYAFAGMFPEERQIDIFRQQLKSGVSRQPMGFEETLKGSINRAVKALELKQEADYAVGVESGLVLDKTGTRYQSIDYATVINSDKVRKTDYCLGDVFSEELTTLVNKGASLRQAVEELERQGKLDLKKHLKLRIQRTQKSVQKVLAEFRAQVRVR